MDQESELLRRAREGDSSAGTELFVSYLKESRAIQGLLRRAFARPEDREEMLHEIFLQLIGGQNTFRGEARLSTYIYQVARITIFQRFRKQNTLKRGKIYRNISEPMELADGPHANPEYIYSLKEARQILSDLINRLPDAYREALRLRVMEDLSYEEIAKRMSLPLNTVSTKIHKGKKLLAVILKDRGMTEVFDF